MKRKFIILLAGLAIFVCWPNPLPAMYQQLTGEQIKEAMGYGQRNAMRDITEFLEEWVVVLDHYNGYAFIVTEFLALGNAAKVSTLRGTQLQPWEIDDAIAQSSGKLVFRVTTFGDTLDFANEYIAMLKTDDQTIPASFWTNGMGEAFGDGTSKPAFQADSEFFFPAEGITPDSQIILIVQDKDGNAVTQFNFDLSKMR